MDKIQGNEIQGNGTGTAGHGNKTNTPRFVNDIDLIKGQIKTFKYIWQLPNRERKAVA